MNPHKPLKKSPDQPLKDELMQPCDYQGNIQPSSNGASRQQKFFDPLHPLAGKDGMVLLSEHLVSVRIGRWLRPVEIVNYRDGNPQNLAYENLELTTLSKLIRRFAGKSDILQCPYCGLPYNMSTPQTYERIYHSPLCRQLDFRGLEIGPEELRQLVWDIPTTHIARLYYVSVKAIEKRCKALGISKPPRGYWTRLAHTGFIGEKKA